MRVSSIVIVMIIGWLSSVSYAADAYPVQEIYQKACSNCHAPKLAKGLQAPAAFDQKAWSARLQQAKQAAKQNPGRYKNEYDYLYHQVMVGRGLMHHGGLCKEAGLTANDCSKQAMIAVIKYMSQTKDSN